MREGYKMPEKDTIAEAVKEVTAEYTADFYGLEVLLEIYARTYHGKALEEVTAEEWTDQQAAMRGMIRAAEAMKRWTLEKIGGKGQ